MKALFVLFVLAVFPFFSFCQASMPEAIAYIKSLGYTVVDDQSANLKAGQTSSFSHTFSEGDYFVVTASDDSNVTDCDVFIYNSDGSVYEKDSDSKPSAALVFHTGFNRAMTVQMKNYSSTTPNNYSNIRTIVGYK